jgi:exopolysaccharide biosynthesis polyprenyl glycosylphosphotransferase
MKSRYSTLKIFIKRNWRTIFILFAISADTLAIVISSIGAYFIRDFVRNLPAITASKFLFFTFNYWIILIFFGLIFGLYRASFQSNISQQYKIAGKAYLYSVLMIFASFYLLQQSEFPRRFVLFFVVLLPVAFIIGRSILFKLHIKFQKRGWGVRNVLIYGDGDEGRQVFEKITLYPELGYAVKGFIFNTHQEKELHEQGVTVKTTPLYIVSQLEKIAHAENIDTVLTPTMVNGHDSYSKIIHKCEKNKIIFKIVSPESENLLRFSYIRDMAGISVYTPPRRKIKFIKKFFKRGFDIVGSSLALILLSPLFLLISIAIFIEDGLPIFFSQKRALVKGKNEFLFYKFRSMVKNAEDQQAELYKINETTGGLFRVEDDPRVTKVGKIIRKFSLDELPQFYNVLKGDMSLVGPRPLSIADLSNIAPENSIGGYYKLRAEAKPGITGLWQISGRRELSFKEMVLLDLYYIDNQSIMFDLEILFETVPVALFGKGAY